MSNPESYIEYDAEGSARAFVGESAVSVFQAIVIKNAIAFYARTGMKVNRAYTPKNMLATAAAITGKKFKRGQYEQACAALQEWINTARAAVPVVVQEEVK